MNYLNIFMNTYEQPENKLTYNFLWLVQYLNNTDFLKFLSGRQDISAIEPIKSIETVFGGGESNPDGAITIELNNADTVTMFIESKTVRLGLGIDQLNRHIKGYLKNNDLLLVITPRESDRNIINEMNNKSIIFFSWQDISKYINEKYGEDIIVKEFIEYGNLKGEFSIMKDFEKQELSYIINWYKNNIPDRFLHIFDSLSVEITDIFKQYKVSVNSVKTVNHYGRHGLQINFKKPKIGLWAFFGLYYNNYDHGIPFVNKEIPDICLFIDLNPTESRSKIDGNKDIIEDFRILEKHGFKCNDNGRLTKNRWRLMSYQKSIKDFNCLSKDVLKYELETALKRLYDNSKCIINYF